MKFGGKSYFNPVIDEKGTLHLFFGYGDTQLIHESFDVKSHLQAPVMFIKKYNEIENPVVLNKDLNNTVPRPPKNSLKILPQLLQNQEKVVNPKQIFDFHNYNQVINSPSNKMSDFHPSPSISK